MEDQQAIAIGLGGFLGTLGIDLMRWLLGSAAEAYALVFAAEAVLFLVSAALAAWVARPASGRDEPEIPMPDAAVETA